MKGIKMPEPFRCETCHYGRYSLLGNEWICLVGCLEDEDECMDSYEEDKEVQDDRNRI